MTDAHAPTPYDRIGGEAGLRRMTQRMYALMDTLPEAAAVRAHPAKLRFFYADLNTAKRNGTKMGPRQHLVSLAKPQHHIIDSTDPGRALNDGVEDGLYVRRRAADDAEHLGRRRLVLQCLAQLCVAVT